MFKGVKWMWSLIYKQCIFIKRGFYLITLLHYWKAQHTLNPAGCNLINPYWIEQESSCRTQLIFQGTEVEGTRLSLVMIYGRVTALLKFIQLQIPFTWSVLRLHTQNASGKPSGSKMPPMATYLKQQMTGWNTKDSQLPVFCREALQSTSCSDQMISI